MAPTRGCVELNSFRGNNSADYKHHFRISQNIKSKLYDEGVVKGTVFIQRLRKTV